METGPSATPAPESVLAGDYLTPGEKFGDFQVMQCLSFGLTGGYYRMQHIREFHEVAVLVIPRRAGEAADFEERFEQVAQKLQQFEHPNAVKVIGTGRIKERYCLFTELVEGVNVNDYMEEYTRQTLLEAGAAVPQPASMDGGEVQDTEALRDKQFGLPPPVVKGVMEAVAAAVTAAHAAGLHHYGLNPTSMILTPDGQTRVFGFGLMEMFGKDLFEQIVSQGIVPIQMGTQRVVINTVDTLSPEVRAGGAPEPRSDLFAIGYCGYFLLTGHKPKFPPRPPSDFSAAIPATWDAVLLRCLEIEPDKRPTTAAALCVDLGRMEVQAGVHEEATLDRLVRRVPVPRGIQRRLDTRSLRLLRLAVLGVFGLTVMAAAVVSVFVLFGPESDARTAVVVKTVEGQTPQLRLRIQPERARVAFRVGDAYTTVDGMMELNMPPGEYDLTVEAPSHKPARLSLKVDRSTQTVDVALEPLYAWLEVKAPPGTRILAVTDRGQVTEAGEVPESGHLSARRSVFVGSYTLRAERENHHPAEQPGVKLELGKAHQVEFQLEPMPGSVVVQTEPAGARIFLNGREMGQTPATVPNLPVNRDMRIDVLLDRYRAFTQVFSLGAGEVREFALGQLERRAGSVVVELGFAGATGPAAATLRRAAKIRVGGREVTADQRVVDPVYEGEQVLEVEHPDYQPFRELIEVADRDTVRRVVTLAPRPGLVTLRVRPEVAVTLLANGREVSGEDGVFAVPPGPDIALEVRAVDYLVAQRTLSLRPNDRQTWEVELVRIPSPEVGKPWVVPYVGTRMVPVAAGPFMMGSPPPEAERLPEEGPRTEVRISRPFWIGSHEVTQAEYEGVMGRNPSTYSGPSRPVENVTWNDAVTFAQRINERERRAGRLPAGYEYRLPTEAEWEYAARAGTQAPFHWGDRADASMGNFKGRYPRDFTTATTSGDERYGTLPVGTFAPNAWGLYDVHGNVREWTQDRFNARLPGGSVTDYAGPATGDSQAVRGGGWDDFAHRCRVAARERRTPGNASPAVGFRLVLAPQVGS